MFVLLPVVMLAVVTFSELCVCLLLLLLRFLLILFLPVNVHAQGYGAVGVCWGKRARVAGDGVGRRMHFLRKGVQSCHNKDL